MSPAVVSPGRYLAKVSAGSFVETSDLPGSRAAASCALSRASKAGDIVAVRKGLYFKGTRTRYGMAKPSALQVALKVLGDDAGVGPTGHSAARAFGLTTQVPATPELVVSAPLPTAVRGVRLHRRNNMRRRGLTYHEVALMELLREWDTVVESTWAEFLDEVHSAIGRGRIDMAKLTPVIAVERNVTLRERFAALVHDLSSPSAA